MRIGDLRSIETRDRAVRMGYIFRIEGNDGKYYIGSSQKTGGMKFMMRKFASYLPLNKIQPAYRHFAQLGWNNIRITVIHEMTSTRIELLNEHRKQLENHLGNPDCLNQFRVGILTPADRERHQRRKSQQLNAKFPCKCGTLVSKINLHKHLETKIHQERLERIKEGLSPLSEPYSTYSKKKITCECGAIVSQHSLPRHQQSTQHLVAMSHVTSNSRIADDISLTMLQRK